MNEIIDLILLAAKYEYITDTISSLSAEEQKLVKTLIKTIDDYKEEF